MSLSERLRMARELGGLAAYELAELAGVSGGYPAHLESGRRKNPGADAASKLARVLGVSLDWLLTGDGQPPTAESVKGAVAAARARHVREPKRSARNAE